MLKSRMGGHFQNTRALILRGKRSSTLASHLAEVWRRNTNAIPTAGMLRGELDYTILWQGDPFSCSKRFGKLACKLCQREWVVLLRHSWDDEANMLNDRTC